jgi:predicted nucleic acid-binding protein
MRRIYLDANILIAHFATDKSEEEKKRLVDGALEVFGQLQNIEICTSMWAVTEMVNILVSSKKMDRGLVAQIENAFVSEKRLGKMKIRLLEVSPQMDYDFSEFFYHVRRGILLYHSGVGDVIHSVIMENNNIADILTFDEKSDFNQIPGLTVLHPKNVKL